MAENFEDRLGRESGFLFDRSRGRFVVRSSGRVVPQPRMKAELLKMLRGPNESVRSLTQRFVEGNLPMVNWARTMRQQIKELHGAFGSMAFGGVNAMGQAQWDLVSGQVLRQLEFFERMVGQVLDGRQALNGALVRRAAMYTQAAYVTYENSRRAFLTEEFNFTLERRVLAAVEHCVDCVEFASRGFVPIGSLPGISDSVCLTNCKCHFEYR